MMDDIRLVGAVVGCLIFGVTSDHLGRYWTCMASNILLFVSGVALGFCPDFVSFTIVRFITGLTYNSTFMSFYVLCKMVIF